MKTRRTYRGGRDLPSFFYGTVLPAGSGRMCSASLCIYRHCHLGCNFVVQALPDTAGQYRSSGDQHSQSHRGLKGQIGREQANGQISHPCFSPLASKPAQCSCPVHSLHTSSSLCSRSARISHPGDVSIVAALVSFMSTQQQSEQPCKRAQRYFCLWAPERTQAVSCSHSTPPQRASTN